MTPTRTDFPLLCQRRINGRPIVYMDAAATSLLPQAVLDAQLRFAAGVGASVHRSHHALGDEATFAFAAARRRIARFLNADPRCVVLTAGATASLNTVARGLPDALQQRVLVPAIEHHSNLLPWVVCGPARLFYCDPREPLAPERLEVELLTQHPTLVALSYVSNVTGVVHPIRELCAVARSHGALSVVDASQAVAHLPIDVDELGADFVAFSGHKVFGPFGTGVLWGRPELLEALEPLTLGGGAVEAVTEGGHDLAQLPQRLEAGTPNVTGVIGLAAALDYVERLGWGDVTEHDRELAGALERELALTPGVRPLMARAPYRIALGSFSIDSSTLSVEHLAGLLSDTENIMVRVGRLCAHPLLEREGMRSVARVSLTAYNSVAEVARFGTALRRILGRLRQ